MRTKRDSLSHSFSSCALLSCGAFWALWGAGSSTEQGSAFVSFPLTAGVWGSEMGLIHDWTQTHCVPDACVCFSSLS